MFDSKNNFWCSDMQDMRVDELRRLAVRNERQGADAPPRAGAVKRILSALQRLLACFCPSK